MQKQEETVNHCKLCGRRLKNIHSKYLGMGKTCYKKWITNDNHKMLIEKEILVNDTKRQNIKK